MSIEKVRNYFKEKGIADRIQEFEVSSATVALAAKALHCEESRIAKTLSFHIGEKVVLIVTAGDVKIDNAKYKAQFGTKAKMLSYDEAETLIGHAIGGVCPFAVNNGVETYLDVSLKRFDTVFPACGSSNSAIELSLNELEKSILILTYSCRTAFIIYLPQITIFAKYYFVCTSLCHTKLLPVPRISFLVFLSFVWLFSVLIKYA